MLHTLFIQETLGGLEPHAEGRVTNSKLAQRLTRPSRPGRTGTELSCYGRVHRRFPDRAPRAGSRRTRTGSGRALRPCAFCLTSACRGASSATWLGRSSDRPEKRRAGVQHGKLPALIDGQFEAFLTSTETSRFRPASTISRSPSSFFMHKLGDLRPLVPGLMGDGDNVAAFARMVERAVIGDLAAGSAAKAA